MSVQCGVVSGQEALEAVMDVRANLEDITRTFGCEENTELAALYYEARKSLDELKKQLKKSGQAGKADNFLGIFHVQIIILCSKKIKWTPPNPSWPLSRKCLTGKFPSRPRPALTPTCPAATAAGVYLPAPPAQTQPMGASLTGETLVTQHLSVS